MKWLGRRESSNVDDRRSSSGGKFFVGGTIGVIILVIKFFMDGDPTQLIQQIDQQNTQTTEVVNDSLDNTMAKFVAVVLADNEDVWNKIFTENGLLNLFYFVAPPNRAAEMPAPPLALFIALPIKKFI